MTGESVTPEQPPSRPLYARQSAEPPIVGPSRGAGDASGPQADAQSLRPRSERCPEPECTDENQCWRCDYEESQAAGWAPAPSALRDLYAAAIASYDHAVGQATDPAPRDHHYGQADAALAVRDREVEQLRARLDETCGVLRIAEGDRDAAEEELVTVRFAIDRVRELHQPMERAGLVWCGHCSSWDGRRVRGVLADWPCATVAALPATEEQQPAEHIGDGANAEDCPACSGTNPPYPFICPGPATA